MSGDPIRAWAARRRPPAYRFPDPPPTDPEPVDPATLTPGAARPGERRGDPLRDFITGSRDGLHGSTTLNIQSGPDD
ncbi:hypothetical protein [Thermomonospora sp. CIF 1]|uniref:hypothetical protein n=1 Tax=Thermomonospora sp. CIF 1 TaxID=1916083 RepID=UPI000CAB4DB9|nr:hypothetical protein [Thermomonospora sp. CIF 1]PKK12947.1 MAG: hypothetical protein BUE48_015630 [Thermomonospora sp. CIF 1]